MAQDLASSTHHTLFCQFLFSSHGSTPMVLHVLLVRESFACSLLISPLRFIHLPSRLTTSPVRDKADSRITRFPSFSYYRPPHACYKQVTLFCQPRSCHILGRIHSCLFWFCLLPGPNLVSSLSAFNPIIHRSVCDTAVDSLALPSCLQISIKA